MTDPPSAGIAGGGERAESPEGKTSAAPRAPSLFGARVFVLVWLGQMVSTAGTSLSGFALGVWVYQKTGSVTQFALINCVTLLPSILVSPLAGALVDRMDRRRAMLLSDVGAGLGTLMIVVMASTGHLSVVSAVLAVATSSIMGSLRMPAYSSATTLLVSPEELGRAAGMVQFSTAVAQIIAPSVAGALMASIGLWGVLLIDLASFTFALLTLLVVRFPSPKPAGPREPRRALRHDISLGFSHIMSRRGLAALMVFCAASSFCVGIVQVLSTPLVLGFASVVALGMVLSIGGVGMLLGSVSMIAWGGPRRRVHGVLGFGLVQGTMAILAGLYPSVALVSVGAFGFLFATPMIASNNEAIWQRSVPLEVQGRVFAARNMVVGATLPFAFLAAGPLADQVFEPLLAAGGPLAESLGSVVGTGAGRGIGLLYLVLGALMIGLSAAGALYPPLFRMHVAHERVGETEEGDHAR